MEQYYSGILAVLVIEVTLSPSLPPFPLPLSLPLSLSLSLSLSLPPSLSLSPSGLQDYTVCIPIIITDGFTVPTMKVNDAHLSISELRKSSNSSSKKKPMVSFRFQHASNYYYFQCLCLDKYETCCRDDRPLSS